MMMMFGYYLSPRSRDNRPALTRSPIGGFLSLLDYLPADPSSSFQF